MIKVRFQFETESLEAEGYSSLNLLAHAQLQERSLNSNCGGHCECGTCRVEILAGVVSAMKDEEKKLLAKIKSTNPIVADSSANVRLSCQTFPENTDGENLVVVKVPAKKLPDARRSSL